MGKCIFGTSLQSPPLSLLDFDMTLQHFVYVLHHFIEVLLTYKYQHIFNIHSSMSLGNWDTCDAITTIKAIDTPIISQFPLVVVLYYYYDDD